MRDLVTLPKAHLHVHLDSTVRWSTLAQIGAANRVAVPAHLAKGGLRFAGFRQFADQNALIRECLRRPEDFTRVAREFLFVGGAPLRPAAARRARPHPEHRHPLDHGDDPV